MLMNVIFQRVRPQLAQQWQRPSYEIRFVHHYKPWKKLSKKLFVRSKSFLSKKKDYCLSVNEWKKTYLFKPSLFKTSQISIRDFSNADAKLRVHRLSSSRSRFFKASKRLLQISGEKKYLNFFKLQRQTRSQMFSDVWNLLTVLERTHPRIWVKMGLTKSVGTAKSTFPFFLHDGLFFRWPSHNVSQWDNECSKSLGKKVPISM